MIIKEMDCLTTTVDDIRDVCASVSSSITENARFSGFAGWFDVHFRVSFDIIDLNFKLFCSMILCLFSLFNWLSRVATRIQLRRILSCQLPQMKNLARIGASRLVAVIFFLV